MLPLARAISGAVVDATSRMAEANGEKVSCKMGCGACCRHLVAISEAEARSIWQLVEGLPEPRRSLVRARFSSARDRLEQAGLLDRLQHADELGEADYDALCGAYFAQHLACPFLEDESCSIYPERPGTCREYLVTSAPENCAHSIARNVRRIKLPLETASAIMRWQVAGSTHFLERWVPLILTPEWAETHPDTMPPQPAIELLRELLDLIAGTSPAPAVEEPPIAGEK